MSNKKTQTRMKQPPTRPRRQQPNRGRSRPHGPPTRDTIIIKWVLGWPRHVKQGTAAALFLFFTLLLAVGLFERQSPGPLAILGGVFYRLFGWGAYPFALGLIVLAVGHLAEAATRKHLLRLGAIVQLAVLGLLLVLESRLLFGGTTGQLVGMLLARPLAGFPSLAQQIVGIGGITLLLLLLFRISWSQMLLALAWLARHLWRASFGTLTAVIAAIQAAQTHRATNRLAYAATPPAEDEDLAYLTPPAADVATPPDSDHQGIAHTTQDGIPPLPPLPLKASAERAPTRGSLPTAGRASVRVSRLPPITLLNGVVEQRHRNQEKVIEDLARKVERTLRSFRIEAEVRRSDISIGPTVIRIGIRPVEQVKKDYRGHIMRDDAGAPVVVRTKVSRILALQNDLALDLEATSIRMDAPVPGQPYIGVEIPNKQSRLVTLREILESTDYEESRRGSKLTVALGRDVAGKARVGDLARFPHLLIAGATGSGKSVCLSSIITCILMQATPNEVRFLMVDPKMVELTIFNGIPHLLTPVVTEMQQVVGTLQRGITEMERRYRLFSTLGVRNLDAYRTRCVQQPDLEPLPNLIIVIDELADLMMSAPDEVESLICRLAQLARATGIHLVVATQRPSVDVITGLIKANFPTRISFMVSSAVDSRTILDMGGAEHLLGRGDMLYLPADAGKPERIQGTFLTDEELERVVAHWRQTPYTPPSSRLPSEGAPATKPQVPSTEG